MGLAGSGSKHLACTRRVGSETCNKRGSLFISIHRRFPVVSGLRVQWDSRKPPGDRVLCVFIESPTANPNEHNGFHRRYEQATIDLEEVKRDDSRSYNIVTREYMAQGHDGFTPLLNQTYLIDEDQGEMMSSIVRKYLLGD